MERKHCYAEQSFPFPVKLNCINIKLLFQIIQGTNLKILGSVELDSGIYQCVATNPVGNVQAAAQLKVSKKGI